MAKNNDKSPKIGAGHAQAMFRQGLAELRGALYPESNVAQPTQYGIFGTKTPGEVAQDRTESALDKDQEPHSILDEHIKRAEASQDRGNHERDQKHGPNLAENCDGRSRNGPEMERD